MELHIALIITETLFFVGKTNAQIAHPNNLLYYQYLSEEPSGAINPNSPVDSSNVGFNEETPIIVHPDKIPEVIEENAESTKLLAPIISEESSTDSHITPCPEGENATIRPDTTRRKSK